MDGASDSLASGLTVVMVVSAFQIPLGLLLGYWLGGRKLRVVPQPHAEGVQSAVQELRALADQLAVAVSHHADEVSGLQQRLAASPTEAAGDRQQIAIDLEQVADSNRGIQAQLAAAEKRLHEQSRLLEEHLRNARRDPSTELANRRAFDEELSRRLAEFRRRNHVFGVMLIEAEQFRQVQKQHGNGAGEALMCHLAKVLQSSTRQMDLVARFDEGQFGVLLPGTELAAAYRAAQRARQQVNDSTLELEGLPVTVTVSCGASQVMQNDDERHVVERARQAMKAARGDGGDRCYVHDGQGCAAEPPAAQEPARPAVEHAELEYNGGASRLDAPLSEKRTDPLTGLPSYRAFAEDMKRRLAQLKRFDTPLSLVVVDVDGLAHLNDQQGREMGDVVLRAVTQFLTTAMRDMDLVARYQGGQFTLTLPGTVLPNAVLAAERIRKAISLCTLRLDGQEIHFTVSAGAAEAVVDDDTATLLTRAGTALGAAKAAGGNCTHFHNGSRCASAENKAALGTTA